MMRSCARSSRPFRLAVINSHPIQYFAPLYAYLNKQAELDVTVLYCSDYSIRGAVDPGFGRVVAWDIDLLSGYNAVFLGSRARSRTPGGFFSLICPEIWAELHGGKYDGVVIHGYGFAAYVLGLLSAWHARVPIFFRGETHLGLTRRRWKQALRDGLMALGSRYVSGYFAIGSENQVYYRSLGIPDDRIFHVPYTVDNKRFIAAASLSPERRSAVRSRLGISADTVVVLYASKLMPRKHPDDVIRAIASLRAAGLDATALIVGTGEMEHTLQQLARDLETDGVIFAGFVNQAELPEVFAASDIFVLPSEDEPWGLVINEAMCAGLPILAGRGVGAAPDLVVDNVNGFRITADDAKSLADTLRPLILDKSLRQKFGSESLRIIGQWSFRECKEGILRAIESVRARFPRSSPVR